MKKVKHPQQESITKDSVRLKCYRAMHTLGMHSTYKNLLLRYCETDPVALAIMLRWAETNDLVDAMALCDWLNDVCPDKTSESDLCYHMGLLIGWRLSDRNKLSGRRVGDTDTTKE